MPQQACYYPIPNVPFISSVILPILSNSLHFTCFVSSISQVPTTSAKSSFTELRTLLAHESCSSRSNQRSGVHRTTVCWVHRADQSGEVARAAAGARRGTSAARAPGVPTAFTPDRCAGWWAPCGQSRGGRTRIPSSLHQPKARIGGRQAPCPFLLGARGPRPFRVEAASVKPCDEAKSTMRA
jgi:hypothetical protein